MIFSICIVVVLVCLGQTVSSYQALELVEGTDYTLSYESLNVIIEFNGSSATLFDGDTENGYFTAKANMKVRLLFSFSTLTALDYFRLVYVPPNVPVRNVTFEYYDVQDEDWKGPVVYDINYSGVDNSIIVSDMFSIDAVCDKMRLTLETPLDMAMKMMEVYIQGDQNTDRVTLRPTTTSLISTSTKFTTTNRQTTQVTSGDGHSQSGGDLTLLYAVVICLCVALCCCAMANVYLWQRRKDTNPQKNQSGADNRVSDCRSSDISLPVPVNVTELPPLVIQQKDDSESESATNLLIRAQPEGVPHAGTRKPPPPPIEGRVQKTKGQQFSGFELADAVADDELDEEIMYIPMPQTRQ